MPWLYAQAAYPYPSGWESATKTATRGEICGLVLSTFISQNKSSRFAPDHHRVIHMPQKIVLASGSEIRAKLLAQAAIPHEVLPARIDEEMITAALRADDGI